MDQNDSFTSRICRDESVTEKRKTENSKDETEDEQPVHLFIKIEPPSIVNKFNTTRRKIFRIKSPRPDSKMSKWTLESDIGLD